MARKTPGLNTSSMADISFLLLAFFLMVSDIKTDKGIARVLPPIPKENDIKPEIHQRNIFIVLVNFKDDILTTADDGSGMLKPCSIDQLKGRVKYFLNSNRGENEKLPEFDYVDIEGLGNHYKISKGVISLQCDYSTSYDKYFQVQNELTAAITELRNELSARTFGRADYMDLTKEQRKAVEKAIPMAISEAKSSNKKGGN